MARVKYANGVVPLRNEHHGYTFIPNYSGQSVLSRQKNDRTRDTRQINKKLLIQKAMRGWRDMDRAVKESWLLYAATYPIPCKVTSSGYLTGYQLFIKRQTYLYLNEGLQSRFLQPKLIAPLPTFVFEVSVQQISNCIDVTVPYISNFGIIPKPGDFLLLKVMPMATDTGQFYPTITKTVQVVESYIDGLFLSLSFPATLKNVVFSVYLSFPSRESIHYSGTKTRYMGCFTTKTFLDLSDTPDSYAGQNGKIVSVNGDETGLVFIDLPTPVATVYSEMSVTGNGSSASKLKLTNDAATPGGSKFYGTDAMGGKGWLPWTSITNAAAEQSKFEAVSGISGWGIIVISTYPTVKHMVILSLSIWDTVSNIKDNFQVIVSYYNATDFAIQVLQSFINPKIQAVTFSAGTVSITFSPAFTGRIWCYFKTTISY